MLVIFREVAAKTVGTCHRLEEVGSSVCCRGPHAVRDPGLSMSNQPPGWVDDAEHGSIWPECLLPFRIVTTGRAEPQGTPSEKIVLFFFFSKPQTKRFPAEGTGHFENCLSKF